MPDYQVLEFIENRLVEFYGENRNTDYIKRLREIRQNLGGGTVNVPEFDSERYKMALEAILCVNKPLDYCSELDTVRGIATKALN